MKIPAYEDLSKEQDAICVLAPLDGATLVSGPPGSGKTVVAFYRAEAAAKKKQTPRVVMYNSVLSSYSSNASRKKAVSEGVQTWHKWLGRWWKSCFRGYYPQVKPYVPDWSRITAKVLELAGKPAQRSRVLDQWGHLIVDEGQDFSSDFYMMAKAVLTLASIDERKGVAITVLADENQRINAQRNSTIGQIEKSLTIQPQRHYKLMRNYRNTYEIARAAAHFYSGLRSGIPDFPEGRHGNTPRLVRVGDLDQSVDTIKRFVANQSDLEIGVFLPTTALQTKYFNKLQHRLRGVDGVLVQRYSNGDPQHGDASKLKFDRPGTVTVLCDSSCKGLEFDAVFIPELQARPWDPASVDHLRMQFYVLSSRARLHLTFLVSAANGESVPLLDHFPDKSSGLLEWVNG